MTRISSALVFTTALAIMAAAVPNASAGVLPTRDVAEPQAGAQDPTIFPMMVTDAVDQYQPTSPLRDAPPMTPMAIRDVDDQKAGDASHDDHAADQWTPEGGWGGGWGGSRGWCPWGSRWDWDSGRCRRFGWGGRGWATEQNEPWMQPMKRDEHDNKAVEAADDSHAAEQVLPQPCPPGYVFDPFFRLCIYVGLGARTGQGSALQTRDADADAQWGGGRGGGGWNGGRGGGGWDGGRGGGGWDGGRGGGGWDGGRGGGGWNGGRGGGGWDGGRGGGGWGGWGGREGGGGGSWGGRGGWQTIEARDPQRGGEGGGRGGGYGGGGRGGGGRGGSGYLVNAEAQDVS